MSGPNSKLKALPDVNKASKHSKTDSSPLVKGTVAAIQADGVIWVLVSKDPRKPIQARTLVDIDLAAIGHDVLLSFDDKNDDRPIILGLIQDRCKKEADLTELDLHRNQVDTYYLDKERVEIEAKKEIVMRCGDCSVTLRKDGKIIIKGVHVISRAKGANKMRGAAVTIN